MQKITPCLWFKNEAEEAVNYYLSIFKSSKIIDILYSNDKTSENKIISISFELDGQEFIALNENFQSNFSNAVSFLINCNDQDEVDYLWQKLSHDGKTEMCGWLVDKFNVSWQIIPSVLLKMIQDENRTKAKNVIEAMLKMVKIDINLLKKAYEKE
jgi:predicted 3-demethylubiquinone-9 3-methyltransferase (glyoxalase superfamily)